MTRLTTILALLIATGAFAQNAPDRFRQLGRNGDGMLSRAELAGRAQLQRLLGGADTNNDGGISLGEVRAAMAGRAGADRAPTKRVPRVPLNTAPIDPRWGPDVEPQETTLVFTFVPDFLPGTKDSKGNVLGGTELMRLTVHGGKLFAGVGYFGQDTSKRRSAGAQVLRKDSAASGWVVDATFPDYVRVDTLLSATFTRDASGQKLEKPVTTLVAGLWWRKVKPWGVDEEAPLSVAVRDDATGKWTLSTIATATGDSPGDVRALAMHTDARTGREYLFAGGGDGVVYRASYDADAPGHLKWEVDPGLPKAARFVTFTECDGVLYVAGASSRTTASTQCAVPSLRTSCGARAASTGVSMARSRAGSSCIGGPSPGRGSTSTTCAASASSPTRGIHPSLPSLAASRTRRSSSASTPPPAAPPTS